MSYLNSSRNIFNFNKKVSKGGMMPHNDPADFKPVKNNRYIPYLTHQLWYFSGQSYEYHTNLKHMQYRGLSGLIMVWLKHYVFKFVAPVLLIIYLKGISQDSRGYYVKALSLIEGPNKVEYNLLNQFKRETDLILENRSTDFLGRRGADFYAAEGFLVKKTRKNENTEKIILNFSEINKNSK